MGTIAVECPIRLSDRDFIALTWANGQYIFGCYAENGEETGATHAFHAADVSNAITIVSNWAGRSGYRIQTMQWHPNDFFTNSYFYGQLYRT